MKMINFFGKVSKNYTEFDKKKSCHKISQKSIKTCKNFMNQHFRVFNNDFMHL